MTIKIDSSNYPRRPGRDRTVLDDFLLLVREKQESIGIASYFSGQEEPVALTYGKMGELVDKLAVRLLELGVEPGEFVSYQFPNRWEFAVAHLATIRIGAVSNAIMPIYGKREIRYMLERTQSRVCLGLARGAHGEPGKLLSEVASELETLEHLILIDSADPSATLESQLADVVVDEAARARLDRLRPRPDDIEVILFSSGTTGEPKGVLHSFNSTYLATSNSFPFMGMTSADVVLMFSPLGHATGFDYGLVMPLICGCRIVYQDAWDPTEMLRIVERERVTWTMGSAAFAKDICEAVERGDRKFDTSSLRIFMSGGAPIPPKLIPRAERLFGARMLPCWGMTEVGIATMGRLTDSNERISSTAGAPVDGVSLRIVDDVGHVLPTNTPGHIEIRANGQHVGFFQNDKLYADSFRDGWYKTGDLGILDDDGYIRIVGRSKDIVIRGGENIPIIEIENILLDHPGIAEICIVGVPDERLGERCHAVVVPRGKGSMLKLADLTDHLRRNEVTKQYWPEFISLVDALPKTASGKVQRFLLRDKVAASHVRI